MWLKRLLIGAAFLAVCGPASAGSATGTIAYYYTLELPGTAPMLFVFMSSNATSPAACGSHTLSNNAWVIRTDTPAGKTHMAVLLMAKALGQTVTIQGKGGAFPNPCDIWENTESVYFVKAS
jgi:hypothetical protein